MQSRGDRHHEDLLLARAIARGDRGSFDRFYERYFPPVVAFTSRGCGETAQAEKLTEETFTRALETIDRYTGEVSLSAWLYAIVRSTALTMRSAHGAQGPDRFGTGSESNPPGVGTRC